ncbi:PTS transporter subunit EIIC [Amphibacillus sp. MSJ-3]|uniref:PTS transporter subunit EIIC n=1 Tax=Amphibacillus sp. MSJ-3 TaxID=2841505 RepID=UPI001C0F0F05|nr:PTS transporter subunit EIIC [Amphibacillus sp. MSJ-3]MBU5595585.1 PTS transporter subunit EIIC [Amphibacillus sp. MSJ-3]
MKTNIKKSSLQIIEYVGGKENISELTHCATRLRFKLKDYDKVDQDKLKDVDMVVGQKRTPSQYQVIIGNEVANVYKEISNLLGELSDQQTESESEKKGVFNNIIDAITGTMTPLIPVLTGAGMIKVLLALINTFEWLSPESATYRIIDIIGDATFYFLPILLAIFASQKFKVNTSIAVVVVGVLMHPNFVEWVNSGDPISIFSLPIRGVDYAYSVIPAILMIWVMSYISKFVERVTPKVLKILLDPTLVLLISAPIALIIVGPLGAYAGDLLALAIEALESSLGFLLVAILAAAMPFIVMTGMHHALTPIFLSTFAVTGYDSLILLAQVCSNLAQAGASLAVSVKSKNKDRKQVSLAAGISALMGITEPAMYGVTLKLKKPMLAAVIGSGIAGLYAGITYVRIYVLNNSIMSALALADNNGFANIINGLIMMAIAIIVPFVVTMVLGFDDE